MNEFDQFVKHILKVKNYLRYTDDFIIVSDSLEYLEKLLPQITDFLRDKLKLELHPNKVSIRKYEQGIDFLGYIAFPHHRLVRKKTVKRIFRKMKQKVLDFKNGIVTEQNLNQSLKSYEGVLSHADTHNLSEDLKNKYWLWRGK
jgi:hypothetical protein